MLLPFVFGERLQAANFLFRFKHCLSKDRGGIFKAVAGIVQFASGFAVRRILNKLNHSGAGFADQIADCGMHPQIILAAL